MPSTVTTRRARQVLLTVAAGALALTAAAGCAANGGAAPQAGESAGLGKAPKSRPSATPTPTASAPGNGGGTPGNPGDPAGGAGNQGNPGDQGGNQGHTPPTVPGPRVVHFAVKQRPTCPQGTSAYPVPAVPLVIAWKVTGAHQVTLSVDGPGVYQTYGTKGSETFTFSCGGAPGTVETHTYTIRTVGGSGPARTRTLTVSATVNEIPQV